MMGSRRIAVLVLLLALPLLLFAQAQSGTEAQGGTSGQAGSAPSDVSGKGTSTEMSSLSVGLYRIGQGLNVPIANKSGDLSGNVQDILVDREGGFRFVVVSLAQGGQAEQNAAGTLHLVPIKQVHWDAAKGDFTFDLAANEVSRLATLSSAPMEAGQAKLQPASPEAQQGTVTGTQGEQGVPGGNISGESGVVGEYVSIRHLIGSEAIDQQGNNLGQIADIVVNIPESRVQYLAMSASGQLGVGERYFAIPMRTFVSWIPETKQSVLGIDVQQFHGNVGFQPNERWPGEADRALGLPAGSGDMSEKQAGGEVPRESQSGGNPPTETPGSGGPSGP